MGMMTGLTGKRRTMTIQGNLALPAAIGVALLTLVTNNVRAETACTESTVRARLAELEDALRQPKVQAKLSAAQKDWQEDQDFDDEENAKYLAVAAAYLSMKRNFDAGAIDGGACDILTRTDALVQSVLSDL
jgi:hypothetical protein